MNWLSYLSPQTVLRTSSRYNRDIRINEERGRQKLLVNGARESGEYIEGLWKFAFSRFHLPKQAKNVLILGVAGGTVIRMLSQLYPKARITGVDIDEVMINIGKTYFGLNDISQATLVCDDAKNFITKTKERFDAVIVDVFIGPDVPDFVLTEDFQKNVKNILSKTGGVMINYLRQPGYEEKATKLEHVLQNLYDEVRSVDRYNNRFFYAKIV
ncbi:MAG TPA: fused MFS/spermidine synthase [Patescibacteria group bacterium]|nr:fused MFS/spermidine synthase [Patescibacteria group bacterium]